MIKIKHLVGLSLLLLCINSYAQKETIGPFTKMENKLQWIGMGDKLWIEPFGDDALRFRSTRSLRIVDQDWNLIKPKKNKCIINITKTKATIINGNIIAEVTSGGKVAYYNADGKLLLKEGSHNHDVRYGRKYTSQGGDLFNLQVTFDTFKDEKLYGMGEYPNNFLNLKGTVLELAQKNTQISIPFLLSDRGYGFIWNNPSVGKAELAINHTRFIAKMAKQIDYVIISKNKIAEIERTYSDLTGKAPVMPYFATGFWQSKHRYATQNELLNIAGEYKKRNIPLSVIVADFYHWPVSGSWKFNEKYWPDVPAMTKELKNMGTKLLVSVWPTASRECKDYQFMKNNNYLVNAEQSSGIMMQWRDMLHFVDVTNPDARKYLWSKVKKNYYDKGVQMFWMDEAEPEIDPLYYENLRYYAGNGLEVSNIYPYDFARTFYEGQKSAGQKDIINLIRCAWIGSQTMAAVVWSGDINGDFKTLEQQIKVGQNMGLCGIPWWTTDIGGFWGHPKQESYKEVIIRWFQFGTFCPIMRLHGWRAPSHQVEGQMMESGADNEIWSYGEQAYEIMKRYIHIREQLRPYIHEQMKRAAETGDPVMRPMFYDFPDDKACYDYENQYMFGPNLLIAPITKAGATKRTLYLPSGAKWTDARNGRKYKGGKEITIKVDIYDIPVFYKNSFKMNFYNK